MISAYYFLSRLVFYSMPWSWILFSLLLSFIRGKLPRQRGRSQVVSGWYSVANMGANSRRLYFCISIWSCRILGTSWYFNPVPQNSGSITGEKAAYSLFLLGTCVSVTINFPYQIRIGFRKKLASVASTILHLFCLSHFARWAQEYCCNDYRAYCDRHGADIKARNQPKNPWLKLKNST